MGTLFIQAAIPSYSHGHAAFPALREVHRNAQHKGQRIVSCGGGIILRENNRKLMKKSGTVILLSATPQTIYENVKDGKDRPLLNGNMNPDYIGKMMQERQPYYEKAKDIEIVTDEKAPKDVAFEIIERLQIPMAGKEEEA